MSAPLLWIVLPAALGVPALLFKNGRVLSLFGGTVAVLLALVALFVPIDQALEVGGISFKIAPDIDVLGRRLILTPADGSLLAIFYGLVAMWFFGADVTGTAHRLIPLGLVINALLVASLAVEPFLYAAILIEMAVLLAIPLIVATEPGSGSRGDALFDLPDPGHALYPVRRLAAGGCRVQSQRSDVGCSVCDYFGVGLCFLAGHVPVVRLVADAGRRSVALYARVPILGVAYDHRHFWNGLFGPVFLVANIWTTPPDFICGRPGHGCYRRPMVGVSTASQQANGLRCDCRNRIQFAGVQPCARKSGGCRLSVDRATVAGIASLGDVAYPIERTGRAFAFRRRTGTSSQTSNHSCRTDPGQFFGCRFSIVGRFPYSVSALGGAGKPIFRGGFLVPGWHPGIVDRCNAHLGRTGYGPARGRLGTSGALETRDLDRDWRGRSLSAGNFSPNLQTDHGESPGHVRASRQVDYNLTICTPH